MKISGLSCETKKIFLVFLGHPNAHLFIVLSVSSLPTFYIFRSNSMLYKTDSIVFFLTVIQVVFLIFPQLILLVHFEGESAKAKTKLN